MISDIQSFQISLKQDDDNIYIYIYIYIIEKTMCAARLCGNSCTLAHDLRL